MAHELELDMLRAQEASEHIFELLAFMGMILASFCSSRDYHSRCHSLVINWSTLL